MMKKVDAGNCSLSGGESAQTTTLMEQQYLEASLASPPPPPPPQEQRKKKKDKYSNKFQQFMYSLSYSKSLETNDTSDVEDVTSKSMPQQQLAPITTPQNNELYQPPSKSPKDDPSRPLSADPSSLSASSSVGFSTISNQNSNNEQDFHYHRHMDNNIPVPCTPDTSFDSKLDWTPPDSSYGAACPMFGSIPKKIRRRAEFTLLLLLSFALIYAVITTSIKLTNEHSHSKQQNNYEYGNKEQRAVDLDDNFYVDYNVGDNYYYSEHNDDNLQVQDDLY